VKKVPALVATVVSAALVLTMGGPTTSAGAASAPGGSARASVAGSGDSSGATDRAKPDGRGGRYKVPTGAYFNNPRGSWYDRLKIERQVLRAIKATRKGAKIRIALYSFDRIPVARALIAARNRGVHVQLLLNDHQDTRAMKMLRARLGTDVDKKDFIYKCHSGCRTDNRKRLLHTKFYTFTKAGGSKYALFFGSANLTMNAARHQWNDLYLMDGDKELFAQYVALFEDMKKDYETMQPAFPDFCGIPQGAVCDDAVDTGTTVTFPRLLGPGNDPIIRILDKIQCITVSADGKRVRTKLAVNMHTIRGRRGNYLADAYRRKFAEGCNARFSFGLVGYHTKRHLTAKTPRGRMPLRSTAFDYHPENNDNVKNNPDDKLDLTLDYYSHQKYLVIQGNYAGNPNANLVFTGSSNWGALGAVNDEILVNVIGKKVARQYMTNFNFMWRPGNSRNAYTTTYTNFRGGYVTPEELAARVSASGPTWEAD